MTTDAVRLATLRKQRGPTARAWLVTYDTSAGPAALLFCSPECETAALEDGERTRKAIRFSADVARAIDCYGCGLTLWECTG